MPHNLLLTCITVLTLIACSEKAQGQSDVTLPYWPVSLQTQVLKIAKHFDGEFALYVKDITTQHDYTFNASTPMYLASAVKIPVMVAVYGQVAQGEITLEDKVTLTIEDLRDGSGDLKRLPPGTEISIDELLTQMMAVSDNVATDVLLRYLEPQTVDDTLVHLGFLGFGPITTLLDVRRLVFKHLDPRAIQLTPLQVFELYEAPFESRAKKLATLLDIKQNSWTANDLNRAFDIYYRELKNSASMLAVGRLLEKIAKKEIFNDELNEHMLQKMLACKTGEHRLRGLIPDSIKLAHKTGTQIRRMCDVGIMYLQTDKPIVVAMCAKDFLKSSAAEKTIALVGKAVYNVLSPYYEPEKITEPLRL